MRLGYYYHAGAARDGMALAPRHFAVFMEELARQAGGLTFFGHGEQMADPTLVPVDGVSGVDIGPRRTFPERLLLPGPALKRFKDGLRGLEVVLVRGPTPLLPHLVRATGPTPVSMLLVGDYSDGIRARVFPAWKNAADALLVRTYAWLQRRAQRRALVLVNSPALRKKAAPEGVTREVFTSSLTTSDVERLERIERDTDAVPKTFVFTGRITEEKGLVEAVVALGALRRDGHDVSLRCVGVIDDPRVLELLHATARDHGVGERVHFPGFVHAGEELWDEYRRADAFVLPSYAEGFPHSVIESLAAGLPSVVTGVGGIPARLEDGRQVVMVEPRSPTALANGMRRILEDAELRARLCVEGRAWARGYTIERSCELIVTELREWIGERS